MQNRRRKICPSCAGIIPRNAILCIECGRDLHTDLYAIVPDGVNYGIALGAEMRIRGLGLRKAQETALILNCTESALNAEEIWTLISVR